MVIEANVAAETFFDMGRALLLRSRLADLLPFGSPVFGLVADARKNHATVAGYKIDISTPRVGSRGTVDVFIAPLPQPSASVAIMLQERAIAEKIDRQLTHRSAARSVTALGAMLAHEIKNPLSGIRGAAQLLEGERRRRGPGADPTHLRRDRPHREAGRPDAVLRDIRARTVGKPEHPRGARSRQASRPGRLRPPCAFRRSLRSLAAARASGRATS